MKLLFLYIENSGVISDACVNLDANIRCELNKCDNEYILSVKSKNVIPKDFYSADDSFEVSAVVGVNGSGKTTIASFIASLRSGLEVDKNVLVVLKTADNCIKIFYHLNDKKLLCVTDAKDMLVDKVQIDNSEAWKALCDEFLFIYYSPVLTSQHPFYTSDKNFVDISSTGLLLSASAIMSATNIGPRVNISQYDAYRAVDTVGVLEFLSKMRKEGLKSPVRFPTPKGVRIEHNFAGFELAWSYLKDTLKKAQDECAKEIDQIKEGVYRTRSARTVSLWVPKVEAHSPTQNDLELDDKLCELELRRRCLLAYQRRLRHFKYNPLFGDAFLKAFITFAVIWMRDVDITEELINFKASSCRHLIRAVVGLRRRFDGCEYTQDAHRSMRESVLRMLKRMTLITQLHNHVKDRIYYAYQVFESLYSINEGAEQPSGGSHFISLSNDNGKSSYQKAMDLVMYHANSRKLMDYLIFNFTPRLSSGEMSLLTLFSRLLRQLQSIRRYSTKKNVLVFLDEAETTLHPGFQREVVRLLIWFGREIVNWVNMHVIFATHSPIILSDIPMGNVAFINKDSSGKVIFDNVHKGETFGAHVFDLYRQSFFLSKGTIGSFATDKIDSLLKKLNSDSKSERIDTKDIDLVRLIGDSFISRLLRRRMDERYEEDETAFAEEVRKAVSDIENA